jgi:hypothetical protein
VRGAARGGANFKAKIGSRCLTPSREPRGLRLLCRSKSVMKIVDAAVHVQRGALWAAQRLCSAARRLAIGLPKSTSADRKIPQGEPSHVEPNVNGPEKTYGRISSSATPKQKVKHCMMSNAL